MQILQAAVAGLPPKTDFILALADRPDGQGQLQPLAKFMTNPAGSAIVNAIGPIRQVVTDEASDDQRYLVVAYGTPDAPGAPVQVQR